MRNVMYCFQMLSPLAILPVAGKPGETKWQALQLKPIISPGILPSGNYTTNRTLLIL
ncbi:hypothetical protein TDB9533_01791 [Thalassocella blandensis]|nr:hypothetical protein TDB9533_01791 [Thalassocella blandensis]